MGLSEDGKFCGIDIALHVADMSRLAEERAIMVHTGEMRHIEGMPDVPEEDEHAVEAVSPALSGASSSRVVSSRCGSPATKRPASRGSLNAGGAARVSSKHASFDLSHGQ